MQSFDHNKELKIKMLISNEEREFLVEMYKVYYGKDVGTKITDELLKRYLLDDGSEKTDKLEGLGDVKLTISKITKDSADRDLDLSIGRLKLYKAKLEAVIAVLDVYKIALENIEEIEKVNKDLAEKIKAFNFDDNSELTHEKFIMLLDGGLEIYEKLVELKIVKRDGSEHELTQEDRKLAKLSGAVKSIIRLNAYKLIDTDKKCYEAVFRIDKRRELKELTCRNKILPAIIKGKEKEFNKLCVKILQDSDFLNQLDGKAKIEFECVLEAAASPGIAQLELLLHAKKNKYKFTLKEEELINNLDVRYGVIERIRNFSNDWEKKFSLFKAIDFSSEDIYEKLKKQLLELNEYINGKKAWDDKEIKLLINEIKSINLSEACEKAKARITNPHGVATSLVSLFLSSKEEREAKVANELLELAEFYRGVVISFVGYDQLTPSSGVVQESAVKYEIVEQKFYMYSPDCEDYYRFKAAGYDMEFRVDYVLGDWDDWEWTWGKEHKSILSSSVSASLERLRCSDKEKAIDAVTQEIFALISWVENEEFMIDQDKRLEVTFTPERGLIEIKDTETDETIKINLSNYPTITSELLYPDLEHVYERSQAIKKLDELLEKQFKPQEDVDKQYKHELVLGNCTHYGMPSSLHNDVLNGALQLLNKSLEDSDPSIILINDLLKEKSLSVKRERIESYYISYAENGHNTEIDFVARALFGEKFLKACLTKQAEKKEKHDRGCFGIMAMFLPTLSLKKQSCHQAEEAVSLVTKERTPRARSRLH